MNVVSHRDDLIAGTPKETLSLENGCPFRRERDNSFSSATPVGLVGVSYHTASLTIRSKVGVAAKGLERLLHRFSDEGFDECMILSTCNRTEVYFVGGTHAEVERIIAEESGLTALELAPHFYTKAGACTALHLFGVASGLDSAVLGETEILAQIKDAVSKARSENCMGRHIDFLVRRSQAASRRVRTETELCRNVTSVGALAVKDAGHRVGGYVGKKVAVIGAGKIAERVAKDLITQGHPEIVFINRTVANAEGLASRYGGTADGLPSMEQHLLDADVVFMATASDSPMLDEVATHRVHAARKGRRLMLVDLGVPANTVREATSACGWDVLDMDVLAKRCDQNTGKRAASIPHAMAIMDQEIDEYLMECRQRLASPTIEALVRFTEDVKRQNLEWANDRLSHLSEKDLKVVADLAARMAKGFLQSPIQELKEELTSEQHRDVVHKLFQLEVGGASHR
jgi:glutamyl-tRNA reductase